MKTNERVEVVKLAEKYVELKRENAALKEKVRRLQSAKHHPRRRKLRVA